MSRRYPMMVDYSEPNESGVRHLIQLTPAGVAAGEVFILVVLALVGSLTTWGMGLLLTVAMRWELAETWRWVLAAGLLPWAVLILASLRLLVAHTYAALERVLGVDLDDSGEVGDVPTEIRFVPVNRSPHILENGVDPADLVFFIKAQRHRGAGQKRWRGVRLPSGRTCDDDYHTRIIEVLERAGVWRGRGPRVSGELVGDPDQVIKALGLQRYDGAACRAVPANGGHLAEDGRR